MLMIRKRNRRKDETKAKTKRRVPHRQGMIGNSRVAYSSVKGRPDGATLGCASRVGVVCVMLNPWRSRCGIHQGVQVDARPPSNLDVQPFLQEHRAHVENTRPESSDVKAFRKLEVECKEEASQNEAHLLVCECLSNAPVWTFGEDDVRCYWH